MKPGVYIPYPQIVDTWAQPENIMVRTKGDPAALAGAVRRVIAGVDPEQPVAAVRTMDEILDRDVEDRTQQMTLLERLRRAGAAAGLDRTLRRALVRRHAAQPRNRPADGARRQRARRWSGWWSGAAWR